MGFRRFFLFYFGSLVLGKWCFGFVWVFIWFFYVGKWGSVRVSGRSGGFGVDVGFRLVGRDMLSFF